MRYLLGALTLAAGLNTYAADPNGYTAKYEKAIGTPPPCSVTISSANDLNWAKLNDPSYRVICIEPGDYTSRGTIALTESGTASAPRWLRYSRKDDSDDSPWDPSHSQAKLRDISLDGASYWIIHRLTVVGGGNYAQLDFINGSGNNIANRMLSENILNGFRIEASNNVTIQNSVIRNSQISVGISPIGISIGDSSDAHIVNNEIYDIAGHVLQFWETPSPSPGAVLENNDLYTNSSMRTDCHGNYTTSGTCIAAEMGISIKANGTQAKPIQIIHNRMWGGRRTDTSLCCDGGGDDGTLIEIVAGATTADWVSVLNNILMDSQRGVSYYPSGSTRTSLIGNIAYKIKKYHASFDTGAIEMGYSDRAEVYLNTIVDSDTWTSLGGTNGDIRCNVVVNSGAASGSPGSGTQVEYNAFFQSHSYTNGNTADTTTRASVAEAQNTEFCFKRKLLTGPESFCIPNVRPTISSPHRMACDTNLGSRTGIGIHDDRM